MFVLILHTIYNVAVTIPGFTSKAKAWDAGLSATQNSRFVSFDVIEVK